MLRNAFNLVKPSKIANIVSQSGRQFSLSANLERRGTTGSKTGFYSSLGTKKHKKFRTHKYDRLVDSPIENVPQLKIGYHRFKQRNNANTHIWQERQDNFMPMSRLPRPKYKWGQNLTPKNREFAKEIATDRARINTQLSEEQTSILKNDNPWPIYKYKNGSRRTGMLMRKLGVQPLWLRDGTRVVTTLFQVHNCHVVKYIPKHEHNGHSACVIVGCGNGVPYLKNENYTQYCLDAGLTPKAKLARFPITENARLQPGTPLHVQHFHVGQYIDIVIRSVNFGWVDVVTRFHKRHVGKVRGRPYHSRLTDGFKRKRGRLTGSIAGRGNTAMNIPNWYNELSGRPLAGRRNAGQLGNADTTFWGRKILRMNTKYQIIYVLGTCAGDVGTYGRIYDSRTTKNELAFDAEPPMFPTYYPELHGSDWADDIFDETVHPFDEPSITFN